MEPVGTEHMEDYMEVMDTEDILGDGEETNKLPKEVTITLKNDWSNTSDFSIILNAFFCKINSKFLKILKK